MERLVIKFIEYYLENLRPTSFLKTSSMSKLVRQLVCSKVSRCDLMLQLYSTGMVEYYINTIVTSICLIAVERFPFDVQNCEILLTSYTLNQSDLVLTAITLDDYGDIVIQNYCYCV